MKSTVKNHHFIVALMLLFCFSSESVFGQEWERIFPERPNYAMCQTPDSSLWLSSSEKDNFYIIKLNKNGNTLFQKKHNGYINSIAPTMDNGVLVNKKNANTTIDSFSKISKDGSILWTKSYGSFVFDGSITELPNQQIIIASEFLVLILDKNGNQLSSLQNPLQGNLKVSRIDANRIFLVGDYKKTPNNYFELEYDYQLNLIKQSKIPAFSIKNNEEQFISKKLNDNSYILLTQNKINELTIRKTLDTTILWSKKILGTSQNLFADGYTPIEIDKKGNIIFTGFEVVEILDSTAISSNATIWVCDKDGNLKSMQRFSGNIGYNGFNNLLVTHDDYYLANGFKNFNINNTPIVDGFLVKTKAEGLNSFIAGKIAIEKNTNCKADSLEQKLSGFIVESEDTKKVKSYAVSDQNGDYWLLAPSGINTLSVQNPSPYFKQICDSTVVAQSGLSVEKDLMIKATVDCPYMTVELSTQGIRPCTTAVYVVRYCNKGAILGKNASIKVKLDPNLTYKTSTKTGVLQADGSYLFALGDVAVNECGVFTITSDVKCDLNLVGKTLCNKAHIYPDSVCNSGNKAKIQVTGNCNAGKVDFLIKNIGKTPMPSNKNYYVIEDDVMYKQGTFQLNPNATFPISITAKAGKTYRIVAEQSDLTLGTIASTALEACVSSPNGNSTGFINQFPLGDDSPFEDEDCRAVVNSFDPNDKTAFPEGTKAQHFIPKNTDLDYLIRFQNSGTDTAFVVVIKDTLSAFLDPATIVPGASSHPYRFTLTDNGVASFIFEKINLPHEKVDKEGSNGFVKFKIKQRPNNPNGTVINNHAAIFFDFNLPIITNTTTNTIGENWIQILTGNKDHENNLLALKIYPNPFQENARIEIQENTYNNLIFNVLDLNGKIIRSEEFDGTSLDFDRGNLLEGFYMYQVVSESKILQTGKMVVN